MTAPSKQAEMLGMTPSEESKRPNRAVASQRAEAPDALDDYPTPPWATRALIESVLPKLGLYLGGNRVWEPAAGRGIMADVLCEYAREVHASDVHAYPDAIRDSIAMGSFVGEGSDVAPTPWADEGGPDWIITNPPFRLALEFFERAHAEAEHVALLCRSNWAEGSERFQRCFSPFPPIAVAQFVERVPMVRGRWDPQADTLTAYSWFVWERGSHIETRFIWIPPGQKRALTSPTDVARFARIGDDLSTIKGGAA